MLGVPAVQEGYQLAPDLPELQVARLGYPHHRIGGAVGKILGHRGQRPVERPGIEVDRADGPGHRAGGAGLSARRGAIDRDDQWGER